MVRTKGNHVFYALIVCALSLTALAQFAPKSNSRLSHEAQAQLVDSSSPHLLNTDESMAVIGAALQARNTLRPYGDCSHLVHTIYEQAGFRYRYADSTDLYYGVPEFRQVTRPQPGDLAVWRGHAAIIVNPAQHTFFSATRSGLRVESYDLAYWKHRGTPRFFRYVKSVATDSPPITRTAASAANTPSFGSRTSADAEVADDPPNNNADSLSTAASRSGSILVHSLEPTTQQLNEGISQYFRETEKLLGSKEVWSSPSAVMVFDQMVVKNVRIRRDQAWAEVKIDGASSLVAGRANAKKRSMQVRWTLVRRDDRTWELQLPRDTTYLQHDVAVRILAHKLAALADSSPGAGDNSSSEQAALARTLNSLLEK